jgi:hypothetical protein
VDPCHKFTWCLDACIREKNVDIKRSRELQVCYLNMFPSFSNSIVCAVSEMNVNVRFEVFMALKLLKVALWVVALCGLVGGYQCFRTYCLHLQS